ncbi:hypothetical protein [Candidatus Korobacter versatilis]|uniref:hypothetical protein n=1 Tax=Candidatus Korobacter versatilis TaxID=658062 RepID=UPI0005A47FF6|nr:hypothetical protein [Candidatus Koribacter versatilis]
MAAVGEFGVEMAFETEQDVSFAAPVVGLLAGRVFDKAKADVAEILGAPPGDAGFASMFGGCDRRPVSDCQREGRDVHAGSIVEGQLGKISSLLEFSEEPFQGASQCP